MARIVVQRPDYSFGELSLAGSNLQVRGSSPEVIVAQIGDDFFDFFGSGFTYDQGRFTIFGTTIDFNIDAVTGGTINGFNYREDGRSTYTVDGFSRAATSLGGFNTLTGQNGPLLFNDLLAGDDSIFLNNGNDTVDAGDGNDGILGAGGNDQLRGEGGSDAIFGEAGNDILTGGFNNDLLSGGDGADIFVLTSALDSTIVQADLILDFAPGLDKLDLSRLDPLPAQPGDQAFTFIGSAPPTGPGQIQQLGNTLFFDADGDGGFEALVLGNGATLTAADIIL